MEKSAQERNKAEEGVGECRGGVSPEQMVRGVIKGTFVERLRGGEGAGLQMSEVARAALTGWLLSRVLGLTPPEGRVTPPTALRFWPQPHDSKPGGNGAVPAPLPSPQSLESLVQMGSTASEPSWSSPLKLLGHHPCHQCICLTPSPGKSGFLCKARDPHTPPKMVAKHAVGLWPGG